MDRYINRSGQGGLGDTQDFMRIMHRVSVMVAQLELRHSKVWIMKPIALQKQGNVSDKNE